MIDCAVCNATVRIDDNHDVRSIRAELAKPEIQGIAFADPIEVMALSDFSPGGRCNNRRIIGAVVGDNKQSVAVTKLPSDVR
jgi:hypothetical protein